MAERPPVKMTTMTDDIARRAYRTLVELYLKQNGITAEFEVFKKGEKAGSGAATPDEPARK